MKKTLPWFLLCFSIFCLGFLTYKVYQHISYDKQLKFFVENAQDAMNQVGESDANYDIAESKAKESLSAMEHFATTSTQLKGIKRMRNAFEDLRLSHQNYHLHNGLDEGDFSIWSVKYKIALDELQPAYK